MKRMTRALSVFDCDKLMYASPWLLMAKRTEIFGLTALAPTDALRFLDYHIFLIKKVSLIKLSSKFQMVFPEFNKGTIFMAKSYLSTRHLSAFPRNGILWIVLNLI